MKTPEKASTPKEVEKAAAPKAEVKAAPEATPPKKVDPPKDAPKRRLVNVLYTTSN